jgi:DNA repair exonuclease SbcCD nuclease subunit
MFRFLYTQDIHLKKKNPIRRTDNYYEAMMAKLEEICQIYKEEKCDCWIDGGDLFEIPLVSYSLIDDFVDLLEKYNIKLKLLYGNHCQIGANVSNSNSTSLAHILRRTKNVDTLTRIETDNEIIQGHEYYFGIENDINERGLSCGVIATKKKKIGIVHALVTERPFFEHIPHNVIGKFKTDYDIILIAHNHRAWGIKEIDGTKFINIGCLGRRNVDESKLSPSCLLYETGKEISIRTLKSAKPGNEVFDLVTYNDSKKFTQTIDDFVEMVNNVKFQQTDIMNIIQMIAKEEKISKDVIDCIIEKIGELENKNNNQGD